MQNVQCRCRDLIQDKEHVVLHLWTPSGCHHLLHLPAHAPPFRRLPCIRQELPRNISGGKENPDSALPWRRPSIKGAYLEYFPGSKTWRRNNAAGRVELFVVPRCKIHILEQISGDGHQRIHLVQQVVHLRQIRRMHQIISTLHNPTDNDNELCQTHQDPLKIQMVRRITQWYKCIMD